MNAPSRCLRLIALLGAEIGAVVGLVGLGGRAPFAIPRHHLDVWWQTTPPADALVAILRVVAVVGVGWLLTTTAAYVVARLTRLPRAIRAVGWATSPLIRRTVDAALAASIAVGAGLTPAAAHAAGTPPPATSVRDGHAGALMSLPAAPAAPAARPPTTATPTTATPTTAAAPTRSEVATTPGAATTVVVEAGDNLWSLAAAQLAIATGRGRADVPDGEVAPYWVAVCELNRALLLSGDPNVIEPGERVMLPPVR
jgi:hypothetical protein